MKHDFGYPFGSVDCDNPESAKVITASCGCGGEGRSSEGHFQCSPNWEDNLKRDRGRLLAGPFLDGYSGWIALVEYPAED